MRGLKDNTSVASTLVESERYRLNRKLGIKPLVKDPIAILAAPQIVDVCDVDVVVMIRNPLAFAASLNRLGWRFDFNNLLEQKHLRETWPDEYWEEIVAAAQNGLPLLGEAALLWKLIYCRILDYQRQFPEWTFVRHEDLSRDPWRQFQRLFKALDLPGAEIAWDTIKETSSSRNPSSADGKEITTKLNSSQNVHAWKRRLTSAEAQEVLSSTREIATAFYTMDELSG